MKVGRAGGLKLETGGRNGTYKTTIEDRGTSREDGNARSKLKRHDNINRVNKIHEIQTDWTVRGGEG